MAIELPVDDFDGELDRWQLDAACRGEPVAAFFPATEGVPPEVAALCGSCEVRAECLDHGLVHEPYGIWGGLNQAGLDRLRRVRRIRIDRPEVGRGGVQRNVLDLHRCGMDPQEIARRLDTTTRSVYRHLADAGITVTEPDDWRRQPRDRP